MFKGKVISQILFGKTSGGGFTYPKTRVTTIEFPSNGVEPKREIAYMSDDGLVLYLLRRIEKLEEKVIKLEEKRK